jgi:hypothetical protein
MITSVMLRSLFQMMLIAFNKLGNLGFWGVDSGCVDMGKIYNPTKLIDFT